MSATSAWCGRGEEMALVAGGGDAGPRRNRRGRGADRRWWAELLAEVETDLRDAPAGRGRHLVVTVSRAPWPLPPVRGDRDLLYLAFHNLAANALKFSDPSDTVEIRAFENRDHVVVEVADTGRGIPNSEQGDVWEELARAGNARGVEGSGLGLALVRSIVAVHGGHASLTSREGAGTLVRLELPAA